MMASHSGARLPSVLARWSIWDTSTSTVTNLWRYYPEGRDGFNEYLSSVKKIYPALDTEKVVFRLFQTKEFGQDYKLP